MLVHCSCTEDRIIFLVQFTSQKIHNDKIIKKLENYKKH